MPTLWWGKQFPHTPPGLGWMPRFEEALAFGVYMRAGAIWRGACPPGLAAPATHSAAVAGVVAVLAGIQVTAASSRTATPASAGLGEAGAGGGGPASAQ